MAEKRSIFEDVGDGAPRATAVSGGLIDGAGGRGRRALRVWLGLLFLLVVLMIAVGGLTRLTDSGLSITEWRPVSGALPPMNAGDWQVAFENYQAIPEYQLQNKGMSLGEFKAIYWWEWSHRQLGRLIGLVWAVGFVVFLAARRIPPGWTGRLAAIGLLGGAQGALGWWMVSSGLSGTALDVASYRLAMHLGLAFVILGLLAWFILLLGRSATGLIQARRVRERRIFSLGTGLMHLAFLQILLGALVAGIDAGRNFTDWPLMAGGFLPPDALQIEPLWRNFFENDGLVQFMHRMAGYLVFAFGLFVWTRTRRSALVQLRGAGAVLAAVLCLQVLLGIMTVIYSAPLHLGILHQLGAVLLWVAILRTRFHAAYPARQSVRG